jgi:stage II sporulation protein AB (anti-sigma F factor)
MSPVSSNSRPPSLVLDLPSEPESVSRARHQTRDYAERSGADPESVAIAVSEAVGNAVLHGYRHGRRGTVRVEAESSGEMLSVVVSDSGVGMSSHPPAEGLGMGLSLIGHVSDRLEIEGCAGGGTRVAMRFQLVALEPA